MDSVERVIQQWATERPELDVSGLEVIGRLSKLGTLVQARLDEVFAEFGLQGWEFDVLATLRRAGEPYELTPGELDKTLIITSGTTTHRLKKLEARGLVERRPDAADGRVVRVRLTEAGFAVQAAAHDAHAANELEILAPLSMGDRKALERGLIALAAALGDSAGEG